MAKAKAAPTRVNAMIEEIAPSKLAALKAVQNAIRKAAPRAVESQTYGARGFHQDGMPVIGVGASVRHLSLYVMSSAVMEAFAEEFDALGLRYSKGTVQFAPDRPLPASLVARIVKARLAENVDLKTARKTRTKARGKK